jgi:hypothetical protein
VCCGGLITGRIYVSAKHINRIQCINADANDAEIAVVGEFLKKIEILFSPRSLLPRGCALTSLLKPEIREEIERQEQTEAKAGNEMEMEDDDGDDDGDDPGDDGGYLEAEGGQDENEIERDGGIGLEVEAGGIQMQNIPEPEEGRREEGIAMNEEAFDLALALALASPRREEIVEPEEGQRGAEVEEMQEIIGLQEVFVGASNIYGDGVGVSVEAGTRNANVFGPGPGTGAETGRRVEVEVEVNTRVGEIENPADDERMEIEETDFLI